MRTIPRCPQSCQTSSAVLGSVLPVFLRNLGVDNTLLQHHEAATSACFANKSWAEVRNKKALQKALQPYRGMYLLHNAKSLGAVAAENNHHIARLKTFKSALWKCTPLPQILKSQCPGACALNKVYF
jgi:hypothetical protein